MKDRATEICVAESNFQPVMYKVLDKDTIDMEIVPYIPSSERGFSLRVPLSKIVNEVLYKMKTGVQCEYLPVVALFDNEPLGWQWVTTISGNGAYPAPFYVCWTGILEKYHDRLDLSSVDLNRSHTPSKRGGEAVEY